MLCSWMRLPLLQERFQAAASDENPINYWMFSGDLAASQLSANAPEVLLLIAGSAAFILVKVC